MKTGLLFLLVASYAGSSAAQPAIAANTQISSAMNEMHEAATALDADRFMSCYMHGPTLTITFDGHTMRGWEAIRDQQRIWWKASPSKPTYIEDKPAEITLLGPDAATTLQWMTISSSAQPVKKPIHLVVTSVWQKRPEGWRIVLAHESMSQ